MSIVVLSTVFLELFHQAGGDVLPSVFSALVVFFSIVDRRREERGRGEKRALDCGSMRESLEFDQETSSLHHGAITSGTLS